MLQRLVDKAGGDMQKAALGIVLSTRSTNSRRRAASRVTSGESVQHALLKIMEAPVKLGSEKYLDTTSILFICGGAFVGLEKIMSRTHGFPALSLQVLN